MQFNMHNLFRLDVFVLSIQLCKFHHIKKILNHFYSHLAPIASSSTNITKPVEKKEENKTLNIVDILNDCDFYTCHEKNKHIYFDKNKTNRFFINETTFHFRM